MTSGCVRSPALNNKVISLTGDVLAGYFDDGYILVANNSYEISVPAALTVRNAQIVTLNKASGSETPVETGFGSVVIDLLPGDAQLLRVY